MPLVHACSESGCSTLTMGDRCLEHEGLAGQRLRSRIGRFSKRLRTPAIGLGIAAVAVLMGRVTR